jgi:hypothetical protein
LSLAKDFFDLGFAEYLERILSLKYSEQIFELENEIQTQGNGCSE